MRPGSDSSVPTTPDSSCVSAPPFAFQTPCPCAGPRRLTLRRSTDAWISLPHPRGSGAGVASAGLLSRLRGGAWRGGARGGPRAQRPVCPASPRTASMRSTPWSSLRGSETFDGQVRGGQARPRRAAEAADGADDGARAEYGRPQGARRWAERRPGAGADAAPPPRPPFHTSRPWPPIYRQTSQRRCTTVAHTQRTVTHSTLVGLRLMEGACSASSMQPCYSWNVTRLRA